MDAITLLKHDHAEVEKRFKRFEKAAKGNHSHKRELADELIELLSVHAAIEETVFYPAVRDEVADLGDEVLESLEEHHVAKLSLSEIEKLLPTDERFDAKVTVMIESVRHHIEEEESDLFPPVEKALGKQRLAQLGEALAEAKKTAPTRPHPFQPDQPPLNAVLAAPVAALDRVVTAGKETVERLMGVKR